MKNKIQTIILFITLDGSYAGYRYFETDPNRGLFCRPDKTLRLTLNGASQRNSTYTPSRVSYIGI
jgi:dynactin complex subunit